VLGIAPYQSGARYGVNMLGSLPAMPKAGKPTGRAYFKKLVLFDGDSVLGRRTVSFRGYK